MCKINHNYLYKEVASFRGELNYSYPPTQCTYPSKLVKSGQGVKFEKNIDELQTSSNVKVDEILIWSSFFGSLIRVNHYSKLKNKNSSYSHLILIKYWAMATDSLLPVMVIVRSTFSLLFLSSQLDILIKAPLICLQTQQRKQIIIFNREFFEVTYWKSF